MRTLPMQFGSKLKNNPKSSDQNANGDGSLINFSTVTGPISEAPSAPSLAVTYSAYDDLASLDFSKPVSSNSTPPSTSSPEAPNKTEAKAAEDSTFSVDIYAAFKEVSCNGTLSEESEEIIVWNKCICEALNVFGDALKLCEQNVGAIVDVASTTRGKNYLSALQEIFEITQRITRSLKQRGRSESRLATISSFWEKVKHLTKFSPAIKPENAISNGSADERKCGICLESTTSNGHVIEFIGKTYHAQCANFWINRIDSLLPQCS
ncbi:hypothetical protein L596_018921 [Steinernema carpocapsae]|uniref:Synergin gamma C-terminal domain-containing protein n=1 Tax=Steinernema carpocapsae TaxID=34508 RepID=A0A4U5N6T3_STECR|nr:hypothetical protein L596_018921 [Steinernema carpocapsae]